MKPLRNERQSLERDIKEALRSGEKPREALNERLLLKIQQRERELIQKKDTKRISLWYLPMVLNSLLFGSLAVFASLFISSFLIKMAVIFFCVYMILAGVLLTLAGYRFTDLKELLSIEVNRRRNTV